MNQNFGTTVMLVDRLGNVDALSFNPISSRELKQEIVDLDATKAREAMKTLTPVEFAYRADPLNRHVGFIAEDVPDLVANPDRKSVPIRDVVALVTKVVKDQLQTIDEQKKLIDELSQRLSKLEAEMSNKKSCGVPERVQKLAATGGCVRKNTCPSRSFLGPDRNGRTQRGPVVTPRDWPRFCAGTRYFPPPMKCPWSMPSGN